MVSELTKVSFEKFEQEVMQKILLEDGTLSSTLIKQYNNAKVVKREFSGYGFYTDYYVKDESLRLENSLNIELGNVQAEIEGVRNGAGFVLFIREGFITTLEGYTYDEKWPEIITRYSLT